jgi:hypothetical protein
VVLSPIRRRESLTCAEHGIRADTVDRIAQRSSILAQYVHKYFEDCVWHFRSLTGVLKEGKAVHYIVGNSKKELFEFVVSGRFGG